MSSQHRHPGSLRLLPGSSTTPRRTTTSTRAGTGEATPSAVPGLPTREGGAPVGRTSRMAALVAAAALLLAACGQSGSSISEQMRQGDQ